MLDVYNCGKCESTFAVKLDESPSCCPFCGDNRLRFDNSFDALEEI